MVHEVENGLELSFLNAFQVKEWVFPVGVVWKNPPKEGRARGQYHFVGSDLVGSVVTAQGNIEKLGVSTKLTKTRTDVGLEVIPPQAEVVVRAHGGNSCDRTA